MSQQTRSTNWDQAAFGSEAADAPPIDRLRHIGSVMRWDGVLPLIAPLCTLFVLAFLPPGGPLGVLAVIIVPIVVALARAAVAQKQLDRAGNGLLRTFGLAIAIASLLLFEMLSSFLAQVPAAPLNDWGAAVFLYAAYLTFIYFALRPRPAAARDNAFRNG
jgi:hypothetical protein